MSKTETKKSNTARYSEEVWACIKAVYEADGSSSIDRLLEIVRNETQIFDLPSRQTVLARAKREDWVRADGLAKLSTAKLTKIVQRTKGHLLLIGGDSDNSEEDDSDFQQGSELDEYNADQEYLRQRESIVNTSVSGVKKLLSSSIHKKKTTAEVIKRGRAATDRIHLLYAHTLDQIVIAKELMTNIQFKLMAKEVDRNNVEAAYNFNMSFMETLVNSVAGYDKLLKADFALYGITPNDTKEPETGTRMQDLNDDAEYEEQVKRLQEQTEMVKSRRMYIESGQLQKEVTDEVHRQMEAMGLSNDLSDMDDDEEE